MKEEKEMNITSDKEQLVEFLLGTAEHAEITDKKLIQKQEEIKIHLDKEEFSEFEEYQERFAELEAEYLLSEYDNIAVNPEEKVFGIRGKNRTLLMDGHGENKMFLESMHFNR